MEDQKQYKLIAQIEELEKRINSLKKSTPKFDDSKILEKISVLQGELESAKTQILQFSSAIEAVSNSVLALDASLSKVAKTGSYLDLLHLPQNQPWHMAESDENYISHTTNKTKFSYAFRYNRPTTSAVKFICSPDEEIECTITFKFYCEVTPSGPFDLNVEILLNDNLIESVPFVVKNRFDETGSVNLKFKVDKPSNYFRFNLAHNSPYSCVFRVADFVVTKSKNFMFLSRDTTWTVCVYGHTYYIVHNLQDWNYYYITNAQEFSFDNPKKAMIYTGANMTCMPKVAYRSTNGLTVTENQVVLCYQDEMFGGVAVSDPTYGTLSTCEITAYGFAPTFFKEGVNGMYVPGLSGVINEKLGYWSAQRAASGYFIPYTLNGEELPAGIWVENTPVTKTFVEGFDAITFKGSVAVREDSECFFFPHIHSTYFVPLGKGRWVNSFLQDNGDINVYLGRYRYVVKKILRINPQTNQYEVVASEKIYGADQYFETLDNKAIYVIDGEIKLVDL